MMLFRCFRIAPKDQKCRIVTLLLRQFPVLTKVVDGLMLLLIRHIYAFPVEAADCLRNLKPTERSLEELKNIKFMQLLDQSKHASSHSKICNSLEVHLQQTAPPKRSNNDATEQKSDVSIAQKSQMILDRLLKAKEEKARDLMSSNITNPKKRQKTVCAKRATVGKNKMNFVCGDKDIDAKNMKTDLRRFINVRAARFNHKKR